MIRPWRRSVTLVVAAVLLVAGCGRATSPGLEAEHVDTLRRLPISEAAVAVVTDVLTSAGVAVVDAASPDSTTPVQVADWQVRNLAVEAANGGGVDGQTLNELAPVPDGAPPMAFLLAAWITTYDSAGARFSRELLGEQDWRRAHEVTFPQLVITLFLADATADAGRADATAYAGLATAYAGLAATTSAGRAETRDNTAPDTGRAEVRDDAAARIVGPVRAGTVSDDAVLAVAQRSPAGPCTTATSFIQNAIATVANALKVNASGGGLFEFLGRIWNTAVDLAAAVVTGLIEAVTRPVVNLLVDVFGVVAVIAQVSSFLTHWRVTGTPDPEENAFGVIPDVVTGSIRIAVADQQLPIPPLVVDCAAAFGVDLTEIGAVGSGVEWVERPIGRPDLAVRVAADTVIDRDRSATYVYQTGLETPELARSPKERAGLLQVRASIARADFEQIRRLFAQLLLDQIPERIRPLVEPIARPIVDAVTRHLSAISDVRSTTYVAVIYHEEPDPEPAPPGNAQPGGQSGRQPGGPPPGAAPPGDGAPTAPDVPIPDSCPPAEALGYSTEPVITPWDSGATHCQYSVFFYVLIGHGPPPPLYTLGVTLRCVTPEDCALEVVTEQGFVTIGSGTEERVLEVARLIFNRDVVVDRRQ